MVLVTDWPGAVLAELGLALMLKSLLTVAVQLGNLNDAIRVAQLKAPVAGSYWFTYQKVQSSEGSTVISV